MIRHLLRGAVLPLSHSRPSPPTSFTPSSLSRHFATFQIVVPNLGDSITEGTIAELTKGAGDDVSTDEVIARLETDKVSIDVRSTGSGKIQAVNVKAGDTVHVGDVLFEGDDAGGGGAKPAAAEASPKTDAASSDEAQTKKEQIQPVVPPVRTQAIDSAHTAQQPQQQQQSHGEADADDASQHRAHHPLIQFRHGRSNQLKQPSQPSDARKQPRQVPASSLNTSASPASPQQQQPSSVLMRGLQPDSYFNQADFAQANEAAYSARQQLPPYYRRKVWGEAEQEAVMMGGAPAYVPKSLQKEKEKAAAAGSKRK